MLSTLYSPPLIKCHGPMSFKIQPFYCFEISSQGQGEIL